MKELVQLLSNIPDAYDDFILGTINYAKKDVSHISILKDIMRGKTNLVSSDIIAFIVSQPDFHSYSATKNKKVLTDELNKTKRIGVAKNKFVAPEDFDVDNVHITSLFEGRFMNVSTYDQR